MAIIDKKQMWSRYRSILKAAPAGTIIRCGVCNETISEGEPDIEYVKTKRGTEIFAHKRCIKKW